MDKAEKFTEWMKHIIECNSYGNTINEKVISLLQELHKQITHAITRKPYISSKVLLTKLLNEIDDLILDYGTEYKKILRTEMAAITDTESHWLSDFMKSIGIAIVIPTSLLSSVKFSPIASQTDYIGMIDTSVNNLRTTITTSLKTAYLMKESTETVIERLDRKEQRLEKQTVVENETFNTTVFEMTNYLIFKANNQKVKYSAILDSKTCSVCGIYDGQIFNIKEAPILPIHENCRCTLIPESICDDELPTYKEWFETLDDSSKKEILGKSRFELYKQGFPLDRFVNNGQIVNLEELNYINDTYLVNISS